MTLRKIDGRWRGNAKFTAPEFADGDTAEEANLSQIAPHTPICVGISGLTFIRCNLTNCDLPLDAIVDKCGRLIHLDMCAHVHPQLVELGFLAAEEPDCPHVVETHQVTIDGQLVSHTYEYADLEV